MSNTVNNYTETDLGNISLNPRGEYDNSAAYEYLDAVSYQGGSYFCLAELETTITGIAPDAGRNSEHWQMIAAPGDMTPEYTAAYNDVIKKAVQVETSRAAVELAQQEIEAVQTDVQQLHSDTVQMAQQAENSKNSAANSAQSAEQSRKTVSESEQNINGQITGFDSRVSEAVEQSKEEINTTKQQAVDTITNQQNTSVNAVKTEGEKIITRVENDAKTVADDRATVEEAAQTVLNNAQEVAQNTQTVADNMENAAASAESAKTSADNATQSAKSVEDASKQIEQNKKDVASLKEGIDNVEKTTICKNIFGGVPNVYYPCNIPSGTDVTVSTEDGSKFEAGTAFNLYSSDKTRKDYWNLSNLSNRTIKTNADISYVTLSKAANANVQIEIGNKSTEYQEYFLDVKMLNKKLDNIGEDDIVNALINRAKIICGYVEKNIINGFLNALDGSIKLDDSASQVTDFVKVIPNEILLYSGKGSTSAANVCFYDKKFAFISSVNTLQYGTFEINVPSETAYARFASRADEDGEIAELIVNIKTKPMYKNNLTGKKWYACGDSFTEGAYIFNDLKLADRWLEDGKYAGKLKSYPYYIGNRTNCDVYNIALSGSTLAYVSSEPKNYSFSSDYGTEEPSYNNYKSVPIDADYITLWFGINDNGYGVPIGNDDDTINTTFKGAYNIVLKHFVENCKKAKIGIIVSNNMPQAYVDATIKMANRWGIKYLDLNSDEVPLMQATLRNVCDEAKANAINKFAVSKSNMHPNYYAHEFESKFIEHWLLSL